MAGATQITHIAEIGYDIHIGYDLSNTIGCQDQVTIGIQGSNGVVGYGYVAEYRAACKNLIKVYVDLVESCFQTFARRSCADHQLPARIKSGCHFSSVCAECKHRAAGHSAERDLGSSFNSAYIIRGASHDATKCSTRKYYGQTYDHVVGSA